jgi:hypothetical protein
MSMDMDFKNHRLRPVRSYQPRPISNVRHSSTMRPAHISTTPTQFDSHAAVDDKLTISIRINLPDYSQWKIFLFAQEYPYLTIAIAAGSILALLLLLNGLVLLWHITHPYKPEVSMLFRANLLSIGRI